MGETTGAKEALNQFRDAINTGPFYPDIQRVMDFLSPALSLFVFLIGIAAVVMVCVFVFRYTVDVIYILIKSSGNDGSTSDNFISNRASKKARDAEDLWQYVKTAGWQSVLALAIAGVLITGQALPLASMLMNVIGSGIDAVVTFTPEDVGTPTGGNNGDIYE